MKANENQNGWDFEMEFLRLFAHGVTQADYHLQTESDEKKMLCKR